MNEIFGLLSNGWSITAIVAIIGLVFNFLLKKFVTEENLLKWGNGIKSFAKGIGIVVTLGLSKIPYIKSLWNKIIEPYVIIFLRLIISNFLVGFIEGLETDNESTK